MEICRDVEYRIVWRQPVQGVAFLAMEEIRVALAAEGRAMSEALRDVSEQELDGITNCPPWTLAELVVHTAASVRFADFLPAPEGTVPREAADYYRRPERSTTKYRQRNVERAQGHARVVFAHASVPDYFESMLGSIVSWANGVDLARVVQIDGTGAMRLGDWLLTRVISLAAHGLDVALTLSRPSWTTAHALRVMRPVFVSLLGGAERPAGLGWDDQRFFEVSTGRQPLAATDRDKLGPLADRFPLLS